MNFKIGDTVWLKLGSPAMSVEAIYPGSQEVRCTWTATVGGSQRVLNHVYHSESLTTSEPEPQPTNVVPVPPFGKVYVEGDD